MIGVRVLLPQSALVTPALALLMAGKSVGNIPTAVHALAGGMPMFPALIPTQQRQLAGIQLLIRAAPLSLVFRVPMVPGVHRFQP